MYNNTMKKNMLHRLGALVLALCMSLSLLPVLGGGAEAAYSDSAMDDLLNWGVVSGYPDGSLRPERSLTRAEFVAMVNRAYGFTQTGPTPFTDVPEGAWYHDDIGIAYSANYFTGVTATTALPNGTLTREQAVVLLGRNMRLEQVTGEVTEFSDGRDFGQWSRGYARAAAQAGIIGGYPDGSFQPKSNITRGDMAVMLKRALGTLINQPGTHTLSDTYGNVTISSPGTTLKDTTIAGDLYLTGGLDLGDITLENVKVLGDIIVAGGGESQSGESIILRNVEADSLKVDSIADQYVSLAAEGNTVVEDVSLRSNAYIQDRTRPGEGFKTITLESPDSPAEFTLSGNLETVVNKTPDSLLTIAMGTVDSLKIDEKATNSTLNLDINSTAMALNLDTAANVVGVGDIAKLYVNAPGSNVEMLPDTITIRPGLVAEIAGETMDAKQAQESSSDPRLLAGYPKVKNIAPTSATAVYSANKSGTVYWAVSTTTDGSIGEEELVEPTKDNTRIFLNGNTPVEAADTEYTAALEKLNSDSNYYLSTVMVDARGRHSPVKVASFTTPDDTVPAFTKGYPVITQNDFEYIKKKDGGYETDETTGDLKVIFRAQVAAMANKSCQIYYALYPAGSAAPTGQQFRTGNLGKPVHSGVEDITKNTVWLQTFRNLEELTEYDLYLWLTDADGARSSAVAKLTFKTVDGTPPRFQYETPLVSGNPPATSIPTRVNINENSTVYWAVVKHGEDFIKADIEDKSINTLPEILKRLKEEAINGKAKALDTLKLKIESGSGALRNGSTRATADRDANINITGLTAESAYDIYYVAKDAAGNYSDVKVLENIHTLDTSPPSVTQAFSRPNDDPDKPLEPYADTDIMLIFNEDVQHYPTTFVREKNADGSYKMEDGKNVYAKNNDGSLIPETLVTLKDSPKELAEFLNDIIALYNNSSNTPTRPLVTRAYDESGNPLGAEDTWTIDFRKAQVKQDPDTGEVTVTLPTTFDSNNIPNGALNLNSGASYHFEINNVQDLATTPNRIRPMPTKLPVFRTIAAQVLLNKDVSDMVINKVVDGSGVKDTAIPIDMSFSLLPTSVNVNKGVRWDMILWSNATVEYELYRRERNAANSNPWELLNPEIGTVNRSRVNVNSNNEGEYIGKGLTYLRNWDQQPFVKEPSTDPLKLGQEYEYAIHFTAVGDVREYVNGSIEEGRDIWNREIEFRINVVAAQAMEAFDPTKGGAITAHDYETMKNQGALEINSVDQDPPSPYFTLHKTFSVQKAPKFTSGPSFKGSDIEATISLATDRPGEVYWVVAPITMEGVPDAYDPLIPVEIKKAGKFDAFTEADGDGIDRFVAYFVPSGEGAVREKIPQSGSDHAAGNEYYVEKPLASAIYDQYQKSRPSERIKAGTLHSVGGAVQSIRVTGLDPATSYYAYFVLQSDGKAYYSEKVALYQFYTDAVNRPNLKIRNEANASVLSVFSMNMSADADYVVFDMTDQGLPTELKQEFYKAMDSKLRAKYVVESEGTPAWRTSDPTDSSYKLPLVLQNASARGFTPNSPVYEALESLTDGGSIYDLYASTSHKDTLRKLITGVISPAGRLSSVQAELKFNPPNTPVGDEVDCQEVFNIQQDREYLFIASGISQQANPNVTADSYGFVGFQPIMIRDMDPPKIIRINGGAYVNLTNQAESIGPYNNDNDADADNAKVQPRTMSGSFDLVFDKDLYLYRVVNGNRTILPFGEHQEDEDTATGTAGYSQFCDRSPDNSFFVSDSKTDGSANVRIITLSFKNASISDTLTFYATSSLVSFYSSPATNQLVLNLRYDPVSQKVKVTVTSTAWFDDGVQELPTTLRQPDATEIDLNGYSIGMFAGGERTLTATPNGEYLQPIRWEITGEADGGSIELDPSTGETITIKALTSGTVKIKATAKTKNGASIESRECTIRISGVTVKITNLPTNNKISTNGERQLSYEVTPAGLTVNSISWSSTDTNILSVETPMPNQPGGKIKGNLPGTATIKLTIETSSGSASDSVTITVE